MNVPRANPSDINPGEWCDRCEAYHRCETCNLPHANPQHMADHQKRLGRFGIVSPSPSLRPGT